MRSRRPCRCRERMGRRRPPSPPTLRSAIIYLVFTISQPLSSRCPHQRPQPPSGMSSSIWTRNKGSRAKVGWIKISSSDPTYYFVFRDEWWITAIIMYFVFVFIQKIFVKSKSCNKLSGPNKPLFVISPNATSFLDLVILTSKISLQIMKNNISVFLIILFFSRKENISKTLNSSTWVYNKMLKQMLWIDQLLQLSRFFESA